MSSKKIINVALFGLSLHTANELKKQIENSVNDDIAINWHKISEPNLDILFINDLFFDTCSIQKIINNNQIHVLKIIGKSDKVSVIENDTLYLLITDLAPLRTWFSEHTLSEVKAQTIEQPILSEISDNSDPQKLIEELLNPMNGKIQIFDHTGQLGLADARSQCFWPNPQRSHQNSDHTLNFAFASMSSSVKSAKRRHLDLKFWLWNLLWKSPAFIELSPQNGSFQLKYWPQPHESSDRRDILRMSACFIKGAQIDYVATHLNIPERKVRQFVAASLGADLAYPISNNEIQFLPKNHQPQEKTSAVRNFFGSLRRRLGL